MSLTEKQKDRAEMMFKLMEYDYITDAQHTMVASFEKQFEQRGDLSDRQFEILESIFNQAAERA